VYYFTMMTDDIRSTLNTVFNCNNHNYTQKKFEWKSMIFVRWSYYFNPTVIINLFGHKVTLIRCCPWRTSVVKVGG